MASLILKRTAATATIQPAADLTYTVEFQGKAEAHIAIDSETLRPDGSSNVEVTLKGVAKVVRQYTGPTFEEGQ